MMMRSSPMIWLFACMYALSAQMCCCQRADIAALLNWGGGGASLTVANETAVNKGSARVACCSKCAQKAGTQESDHSPATPKSGTCDDCDQCAGGGSLDDGVSPGKNLELPSTPLIANVIAATTMIGVDVDPRTAMLSRLHNENRNRDHGQRSLVKMHCALMV